MRLLLLDQLQQPLQCLDMINKPSNTINDVKKTNKQTKNKSAFATAVKGKTQVIQPITTKVSTQLSFSQLRYSSLQGYFNMLEEIYDSVWPSADWMTEGRIWRSVFSELNWQEQYRGSLPLCVERVGGLLTSSNLHVFMQDLM